MRYVTKEQADKAAEAKNNKDPDWFCPLINGMCRKDCTCFEKSISHMVSYHFSSNEKGFDVSDPYCGNAMFSGETWEQNGGY